MTAIARRRSDMGSGKVPHKLTGVKERSSSIIAREERHTGAALRQELPSIPTASPVPGGDMTKRLEELAAVKVTSPTRISNTSTLKIDLGAINLDSLLGPGETG